MIQQLLSVSEYHVQEMSDKTKFYPEVLIPRGRILCFRMCCIWWNLPQNQSRVQKRSIHFPDGISSEFLSPSSCKAQGDSGSLVMLKHLHLVPFLTKMRFNNNRKKNPFSSIRESYLSASSLHLMYCRQRFLDVQRFGCRDFPKSSWTQC